MNNLQVANYQDIKHLDNSQVLPQNDNCRFCGERLEVREENNGFDSPDPEHKELFIECPNGCNQTKTSVIL